MRRRDILKMLWNPIPTDDGDELKENGDDDDDDDDFQAKTGSKKNIGILREGGPWSKVKEAVDCVTGRKNS